MGVKPGGAWWILGMGAISTYGEEPKYPDAGPVIDLILTPSGTSVAMSWMPPTPLPGVVPPVGYVVKLEETGETVDVTDTNYIWDGLQIDTSYCFSVYSKSELGTLSAPVKDCVITLKEVGADDAAQITHIGTSTFAISNPTRGIFEYYLSRSDTDFSQASLIADPSSFTVAQNSQKDLTPYYVLTTYPGVTEISLMQKTSFVCTAISYTLVNEPVWVPCTPPGPVSACCYKCDGTDWTCCCQGESGCRGTPCSDGTICCRSCSGGSYKDNWVNKKDSLPAGYTERYGEWVKIEIPEGTTTSEATPFSSFVDFTGDYYVSFTGLNPEDDPLVSLIFYDGEDPYAFYSYPTEKEHFEFHKPLGGEPELWIKNLSELMRGSRYELVAYSDNGDTEMFREEGNVA